ncbi:MAG: TQXA domain-containing protein [Propionibacteriaceae bacterium]|nr:TQXA domain-containing protein [Propionibacteriaceae bacterium]
MITLIGAGAAAPLPPQAPTAVPAAAVLTAVAPGAGPDHPAPRPVPALSRMRGGMYSSTVDLIRFADGTTAHTDLIRLNPNIDAYSVDFRGVSPRRLAHYREAPWRQAPAPASRWHREITRLLENSYPAVPTAELTRRLREHGYPLGNAEIRRHEAIAATQAAIWRLTNGLELDTRPLDLPIEARARIGEHPSGRSVEREDGRLNWHTPLPAGETVYLELTLAEALQLRSFGFTPGSRTGRHRTEIHLEQSADGIRWSPVSRSAIELGERRLAGRPWQRRLGTAATLSSADASGGHLGHRHYRLAAQGPWDRDGLLDLRDIHLTVGSGRRFRNNERVVYLYELLVTKTSGPDPVLPLHQARLLIGSSTPTGPSEFTPAVALVPSPPARTDHQVVPIRPELGIPGLHPSTDLSEQEPSHVR